MNCPAIHVDDYVASIRDVADSGLTQADLLASEGVQELPARDVFRADEFGAEQTVHSVAMMKSLVFACAKIVAS